LRGTEIGFCCEPYWLAFANKEEAEKFAKGFGGEVLDFEAALKAVQTDHLHMLHEVQ
jgi:nitrous oxide reductase accessory protein NosL